jgi:hypothetical protein
MIMVFVERVQIGITYWLTSVNFLVLLILVRSFHYEQIHDPQNDCYRGS